MRSGYVGGTVLDLFLQHPKAKTFAITTPVRSPAKAKLLEQLGVKAPIASLDDHDKLESLASSADVVFNIVRLLTAARICADRVLQASSDHLPGTQAILKGMRKFFDSTGRRPILIHTVSRGPPRIASYHSPLSASSRARVKSRSQQTANTPRRPSTPTWTSRNSRPYQKVHSIGESTSQ